MKKLNTLKNALLIAFCLFIFAQTSNAQGLFIKAGGGYGIGASMDPVGTTVTNLGEANQTTKVNFGSFGGGINGHVGVGYMFSPYFGFELDILYLMGTELMIDDFNKTDGGYDRSSSYTRQLRAIPSFIVTADNSALNPYAKFGVILPLGGGSTGVRTSNDPSIVSAVIPALYPTATNFDAESKIGGQFGLGFKSSIGVTFDLNSQLAIYAEGFYSGFRVRRGSYEVESATLTLADGSTEDVLNLLTLGGAYAYTEYVDEINLETLDTSAADYGTTDNPAQELTVDGNFNSLGLNVGIKVAF